VLHFAPTHLYLKYQEKEDCLSRKDLPHEQLSMQLLQSHLDHFLKEVDQEFSRPQHYLCVSELQLLGKELLLRYVLRQLALWLSEEGQHCFLLLKICYLLKME
jgi:hypothetical protein